MRLFDKSKSGGSMTTISLGELNRETSLRKHHQESIHLDPLQILVVEDDIFSQKLFRYVIDSFSLPYSVIVADSYSRVVELLPTADDLALAIIDVNLDGNLSGINVLHYLNEMKSETPCILTTSLPKYKYKKFVEKINRKVPVLEKPFLPHKCRLVLEKYLRERREGK